MNLNCINRNYINNLAAREIVKRGHDYFKKGRVKNIFYKGKEIIAEVEGTELYEVSIKEVKKSLDTSCSCPYDGYRCKHVIAVLFHLLDIKEQKDQEKKTFNLEDIKFRDVIKNLDNKNLLNVFKILKEVVIENENGARVVLFVDDKIIRIEKSGFSNLGYSAYCSAHNQFFRNANNCIHVSAAILYLSSRHNKNFIPNDFESGIINNVEDEKYTYLTNTINSLSTKDGQKTQKYKFFIKINNDFGTLFIEFQKSRVTKDGGLSELSNASDKFLETYQFIPESIKELCNLVSISKSYLYQKNKISDIILKRLRDLYKENPDLFLNCILPNKTQLEIILKQSESKDYKISLGVNVSGKLFLINKSMRLNGNSNWFYISQDENFLVEISTMPGVELTKIMDLSSISIPANKFADFIDCYINDLQSIGNIVFPEQYSIFELENFKPKPRLFLSDNNKDIKIDLKFLYGEKEIHHFNKRDIIYSDSNKKIVKVKRDFYEEVKFSNQLLASSTEIKEDYFIPSIDSITWVADKTKELINFGFEIFGQDSLVNYKINKYEPELKVNISSNIDWFDIKGNVKFGDNEVDLSDITKSINNQERFIKLSDGTLGVIPKKWLSKLSGVLGLLEEDAKTKSLKAARTQIKIIESVLDISTECKLDSKFKEVRDKLKNFEKIEEKSLPKTLKAVLRDYQKVGYNWLNFLKDFSFGGCLSDDMGLGKTIQVLTLLLNEKENGNKVPSLIIVPTSLVFNWVEELNKFTPTLSYYVHHGNDRLDSIKLIVSKQVDIILTTYGTIRNDISMFKKTEFYYAVLDESQNIKNPLAQVTKCIYELKSQHRLIMTGTPIENNSFELWSQFAFINPGLLGNIDYFKNTFAKSIEYEKDKNKVDALKNTIYPFILSRKKEMVAKDLPPKQISTIYCEMTDKQREFYEFWKNKYREEIISSINEKGFMKSKLKVLAGLTILRQICNHPNLVDESYTYDSGKFNVIINHVKEIVEEGHKVLIFSAFVKMLKVLQAHFNEVNIKYCYLDGKTKDRKEQVNTFQTDNSIKLFLISLKAGGLGLNLTEADYVVLVDPWWNPAVEMQAIDRCHRIGQTKNIFVYKFITKDSIEEKILSLQESKKELVKNIISIEEGVLKKLDQDFINKLFDVN